MKPEPQGSHSILGFAENSKLKQGTQPAVWSDWEMLPGVQFVCGFPRNWGKLELPLAPGMNQTSSDQLMLVPLFTVV
jgi:hypothetical protein